MQFEELDQTMRKYECSLDQVLLPELYMVARLDGRSFTKLTKRECCFEAPFDERFRDLMCKTTEKLMDCGFRVIYGFTQSDEISLLFHPNEDTFGRKVRKYNSLLAGVASATFSMGLGKQGIFDCRMVPLPTLSRVKDYFLWRQEDAHRNALNAHCYWRLRKAGADPNEATAQLEGKSISYKNELLFSKGINFDKLPNWQKRGIGLYFKDTPKEGFNPKTGETTATFRRQLFTDFDLPLKQDYADFIEQILIEVKE